MEDLLKTYEKKNVFFIHILGGDEDLSLIHFKKHYRLNYPVIPDNLDQYRHIIRVTGISNVAVFGGDGVCVYNEGGIGPTVKDFQKVIDKALREIRGPNRRKSAYVEHGTVYAPEVRKEDGAIVRERMARLAPGPDGEVHLVFVSDESGSNDVFLRTCTKGKWGKDIPVADGKGDEFAPVVAATGPGEALVAYVGETRDGYQIFTAAVKDGKAQTAKQVTKARDDAMAPSLCLGADGDLWLAWYEWAMMGEFSRDREIFVARARGSGWSEPVQASPRDVPAYEDHGEPVIRSDGKGGAWVAWTWDYHGTLQEKPPVDENSIFVRHVDKKMKLGDILAAGFRGEGRARDYVPTLAVTPDGTPWVAWDNSHKASLGYGAKAIFVNHLGGEDFAEQTEAAAHNGQLDTPNLLADPEGGLRLVWGQQQAKSWELKQRKIDPDGEGEERSLKVKGKVPRYPSACFDSEGDLWVAYTDTGSRKWKVRAEKVK